MNQLVRVVPQNIKEKILYTTTPDKIQILKTNGLATFYVSLKNVNNIESDGSLVFWTQYNDSGAGIYCCDSGAMNQRQVYQSSNYSEIHDIVLDEQNKQIYFIASKIKNGDIAGYYILKVDYDGNNFATLVTSSNAYMPHSIKLGGGYIFWCDSNGITEGFLMRCALNGSNVVELLVTSGHIKTIFVKDRDLYIGGIGLLARTDFSGNKLTYLSTSGLSIINDIAIDRNDMYLCDIGINCIVKTDLNGNDPKRVTHDSIKRQSLCLVG